MKLRLSDQPKATCTEKGTENSVPWYQIITYSFNKTHQVLNIYKTLSTRSMSKRFIMKNFNSTFQFYMLSEQLKYSE